jgi:hypothetical protein
MNVQPFYLQLAVFTGVRVVESLHLIWFTPITHHKFTLE